MDNLPSFWAPWYSGVFPFSDWFTLRWHQPGIPDSRGNLWTESDSDGMVQREFRKPQKLEHIWGSARSSVDYKVLDGNVRIDGNPTKFDPTSNIDGGIHPGGKHPKQAAISFVSVAAQISKQPLVMPSDVVVNRIDLTKHLPVPRVSDDMRQDQADLLRWLGLAASHRGRAATASSGRENMGTVYLKASSRRWSLKVYSKGNEVRDQVYDDSMVEWFEDEEGNQVPSGKPILWGDLNEPWLWGSVRIELTLRYKELVELPEVLGYDPAKPGAPKSVLDLDEGSLDELWRIYWRRLRMPKTESMTADKLMKTLPRHLRGVYGRWMQGEDFSQTVTRMTLWRYRKALMDYGVNIDNPPQKERPSKAATAFPEWAKQVGEKPGGTWWAPKPDPNQLTLV